MQQQSLPCNSSVSSPPSSLSSSSRIEHEQSHSQQQSSLLSATSPSSSSSSVTAVALLSTPPKLTHPLPPREFKQLRCGLVPENCHLSFKGVIQDAGYDVLVYDGMSKVTLEFIARLKSGLVFTDFEQLSEPGLSLKASVSPISSSPSLIRGGGGAAAASNVSGTLVIDLKLATTGEDLCFVGELPSSCVKGNIFIKIFVCRKNTHMPPCDDDINIHFLKRVVFEVLVLQGQH